MRGDKIIKNLVYLQEISNKMTDLFRRVWLFYRDGFRNQTWGRPLIWLVVLKFFILFAILKVFFFRPAMDGMTDAEKSEAVGENLTRNHDTPHNTKTYNLNDS